MLTTFANFLPYLDMVITLGLALGGFYAIRAGRATSVALIQSQAIEALQAQISTIQQQADDGERELTHLRLVLATIRIALKRRSLFIEINGSYVSIRDEQAHQPSVTTFPIIDKEVSDDTPNHTP